MDAVKYLKEAKRMCDTVGDCRECPLNSSNTVIPCKLVRDNWELTNPEKIVAIVEKWAAEHRTILIGMQIMNLAICCMRRLEMLQTVGVYRKKTL